MSLEQRTRPGADVTWLPTHEGGVLRGFGGLCRSPQRIVPITTAGDKYLPFIPNGISYVETQGFDVISFNFTGCLMAAYVDETGARRVCHVATGENGDCKPAWEEIKKGAKSFIQFKPSESIARADFEGQAFTGCYGIITATDECFAVVVAQRAGKRVVVHREKVTPEQRRS